VWREIVILVGPNQSGTINCEKSIFACLLLCGCQWVARADPITIRLTEWRFTVDNALNLPELRFQFSLSGVGSDGKTFQFISNGQGNNPHTDQPNEEVLFTSWLFSYFGSTRKKHRD
jgi:hypothetical protein